MSREDERVTQGTLVGSANVLCSLGRAPARAALRAVLEHRPDLVGLQEWRLSRAAVLRETGTVEIRMTRRAVVTLAPTNPSAGYHWLMSWGDCPVGVRADRFEVVGCRTRVLGWLGPADPGSRPMSVAPPRVATVALLRDRFRDPLVALVNFHLVPGVQAGGRYRDDRPLLAARHRAEVRRVERLVEEQAALGHVVYAVGDSNYDGLRLPGLTSAWQGHEGDAGTLGSRKVDDVHGPGPATRVTLVSTASDHKAVLAERQDLR